ncbi:DUF4157 domain-containing protein [Arthrobacter sp. MYb227]|uniref:DUF4157 domain-containing protein n=1 Tax=Arthrobacter sp. MYb227 TaxID=1848601 RepID=UPI0021584DCC|nr:DUF4157 domain-containing protein [Arthrobacter sp. MYb227]
MDGWKRLRALLNWVNLSTPSALIVARATGCRVVAGPSGLHYALNYSPRLPLAGAFTMGNVVFFRPRFRDPSLHPHLVAHEETHCTQYALCLGLPFIGLYFAAAAYSLIRTGDPASANIFERFAGLRAGGYVQRPTRNAVPAILVTVVGRIEKLCKSTPGRTAATKL